MPYDISQGIEVFQDQQDLAGAAASGYKPGELIITVTPLVTSLMADGDQPYQAQVTATERATSTALSAAVIAAGLTLKLSFGKSAATVDHAWRAFPWEDASLSGGSNAIASLELVGAAAETPLAAANYVVVVQVVDAASGVVLCAANLGVCPVL